MPFNWSTLEMIPHQATVPVTWRNHLGDAFELFRDQFLRRQPTQASRYPCPRKCGCTHRVVVHDDGHIVAVCDCEGSWECDSIGLTSEDVVVLEPDTRKLCEAMRSALGLDAVSRGPVNGAPHTYRVGSWGPAQTPVFFMVPYNDSGFLRESEVLFSAFPDPFIVLTATGLHYSQLVETVFRRHLCVHVPLSRILALETAGGFRVIQPLDACLAGFGTRAAAGAGLVKAVERIDRNMDALAKGTYELRRENEELKEVVEKRFSQLVKRVAPDDFQAFAFLMAYRSAHAAAHALEVPFRSFYDRIARWKTIGTPAYRLMSRLVEWKQETAKVIRVRLDDSLLWAESGGKAENPETIRTVLERLKTVPVESSDYATVLGQIFQAMASQNASNWRTVNKEVLALIRDELPQ